MARNRRHTKILDLWERTRDMRIRQNREFFNISPAMALDIMRDIADLLDDAELCIYVDGKPVISNDKEQDKVIRSKEIEKERHKSRPAFKFHMVGINIGDTVVFDELKLPVKVASDDKIEYDGRLYSLSAFTGTFLPEEKQNNSGAYQGPKYFSFKGKVLADLRKELEDSDE